MWHEFTNIILRLSEEGAGEEVVLLNLRVSQEYSRALENKPRIVTAKESSGRSLSVLQLFACTAVAATVAGAAVAWFRQFAVRSNAGLRHAAPKKAVPGAWNRGIRV